MSKRRTPADRGGSWIRPEKRKAIYLRDGFSCVYCGRHRKQVKELTIDHVVPPCDGGKNVFWNLITACKECNSAKQNQPLEKFLQALAKRGIDTEKAKEKLRRVTGKEDGK